MAFVSSILVKAAQAFTKNKLLHAWLEAIQKFLTVCKLCSWSLTRSNPPTSASDAVAASTMSVVSDRSSCHSFREVTQKFQAKVAENKLSLLLGARAQEGFKIAFA
jgi:hypothetical protein